MKRILAILLTVVLINALGLATGVGAIAELQPSKNDIALAMTLSINTALEEQNLVDGCQFWLTTVDDKSNSDRPVVIVYVEKKAILILGETYVATWIFESDNVFAAMEAFCADETVTNIFDVRYQ